MVPGNGLSGRLFLAPKGLAGNSDRVYTESLAVQPNHREEGAANGMPLRADPELHAPQREAAIFYGMFLRGRSVEDIRQEIDISPKLFQKWMRAREYGPGFRDNLRRMYTYRKQVLAIFESFVTSEKKTHDFQSQ